MTTHRTTEEIEPILVALVYKWFGPKQGTVTIDSMAEECCMADSLDLYDYFLAVEQETGIAYDPTNPIAKYAFTKAPWRLRDLAHLLYLLQDQPRIPPPIRTGWFTTKPAPMPEMPVPFTQLDGVDASGRERLLEPFECPGLTPHFRRRTDGMRCVAIPAAEVVVGSDDGLADERPEHRVRLDSFVIDAEPVSTTAYCRFLNSVGEVNDETLEDWFLLPADEHRDEHQVIRRVDGVWRPVPGLLRWPMVLVSWYGANAYSLWANRLDWRVYRSDARSFLPSEAQWEYAARGAEPTMAGRHQPGATYAVEGMHLAEVQRPVGVSSFGLHHMTGTIWQWCRDWYAEDFYHWTEATEPNPVNRTPTAIRGERGGSWVGPAELCRPSYRRGRPPQARGRCLGFRCISHSGAAIT